MEVVFGGTSGYIADDGHGAMPDLAPVPMDPAGAGLWQATLPGYERFAGRPYLYRVTRDDGQKVVYHENHDEAGNAANSLRTIRVAAGGAPLVGATRRHAEARCRFACGMTMLSPGTPLFLMGEEVGAEKAYTYDRFNEAKEDLHALRAGSGANLFRFYQDVIAFRLANPAVRSHDVQVLQSDAAHGGDNVGNLGATLHAAGGTLAAVVPANGFVILERAL